LADFLVATLLFGGREAQQRFVLDVAADACP
jgi:hypothetical protein